MRTKVLSLFALSIFAFIFLMSGISAGVDFVSVNGATQSVAQGDTATVSFALQEDGYGNLTNMSFNVPLTLTSGTNNLVSASSITNMITTLNDSETSGTMSLTFSVPSTKTLGTYTENLTLTGTYATVQTYDLPISITVISEDPSEVLDCQAIGNPGNLEVKKIDFSNNGLQYGGFGEDDEWFPFEEIEVEIEVESDDYDIEDISVEWGIYSLEDNDWLIELDEEDEINLKDGDQETFLITFTLDDDLDIDLDEFVDNSENYRFYVIATGTIDDDNAGVDDGEDTCAFDYEAASIIIESDFVILDNIDMPETLSCGQSVIITADVWNIGDRDQDEVSVEIYGRESILAFDEVVEVGDIDAFDKQQLTFTFTVPQDIDEKYYALNFEVRDEDDDVYENDFDDDLSEFTVPFKVEGNCGAVEISEILISASLESEAKAGQEMLIKATVTNNGNELKTLTINAAEFGTWANLISQDQNTLVLDAGQSKSVLFTFDINKDASGTETFYVEVVSGSDVTRRPVSVNIDASKPFLGITGLAIQNPSLWGLGLLNLILIVIIVIVAVRIAKRR